MPVSKETLQGYILEEILAYLIRNTGYRVLNSPNDDPNDLDIKRGSLVVKGRGAEHQVDVLGQLDWIPAFTYPLRLFVEAKFRKNKTGLPIVRNAVGVVLDINQKYQTIKGTDKLLQRYHYAYSLFSMSGFTDTAQDMAIAHQISLIDLSGPEYLRLRNLINEVAEGIFLNYNRAGLVNNLRFALRDSLQTVRHIQFDDYRNYNEELIGNLKRELEPVIRIAHEYDELFLGMVNGPFMLILKARDSQRFLNYMRRHPRTQVAISWSREREGGSVWTARPRGDDYGDIFELEFRLPERLYEYVFGTSTGIQRRAYGVKEQILSNISIFWKDEAEDRLFRLEFDREETERQLRERNRRN